SSLLLLPPPPRPPLFPYTTLFRSRRNVRSHRPRRKDRHGAAPEEVRRGTAVAQASRRRDAMQDIQRATAGRSEFQPASFADLLRSEEHTSELQSLAYLVCRLLLEK